jgi:hypothetical protein
VPDDAEIALTEFHDIVCRDRARHEAAPPGGPAEGEWIQWVPDDVLLFRYSALTFNGAAFITTAATSRKWKATPGSSFGTLIATFCWIFAPRAAGPP